MQHLILRRYSRTPHAAGSASLNFERGTPTPLAILLHASTLAPTLSCPSSDHTYRHRSRPHSPAPTQQRDFSNTTDLLLNNYCYRTSLAEKAGLFSSPISTIKTFCGQRREADRPSVIMANHLRGIQATLTTTLLTTTHSSISKATIANVEAVLATSQRDVRVQENDSTLNGVVIGLLSSFGSAVLIAFVFLIIYFFRYTAGGRILLDRIGRPGEYDDEQAYAREEAEALEEMDDLQRTEYLRAKGIG